MIVSVSVAAALCLSSAAPAQSGGVRALAVQYADGRRTVTQLSTSGRVSWTPMFPRSPGAATDRDGLQLRALQFEEALEDGGVAVTLALLYGMPHQTRVPVATVHLTGSTSVRVDALEAFGVRPVVLSLVELPPASLLLPSITTPSSSLEISVETVTDPTAAYHATIVNRSSQAVMMLAFTGYRGTSRSITGRPRGSAHTPLIPPGGSYVLKIGATPSQGRGPSNTGWLPLDRLEIRSVLWSDGVVEGDAEPAADEYALDAGTARQLDRILEILRGAAGDPAAHAPPQLKASLTSLGIDVTGPESAAVANAIPGSVKLPEAQVNSAMRSGMQNAKNALLNDVEDIVRLGTVAPSEYAAWLARTIEKYDGWRRRIRG